MSTYTIIVSYTLSMVVFILVSCEARLEPVEEIFGAPEKMIEKPLDTLNSIPVQEPVMQDSVFQDTTESATIKETEINKEIEKKMDIRNLKRSVNLHRRPPVAAVYTGERIFLISESHRIRKNA